MSYPANTSRKKRILIFFTLCSSIAFCVFAVQICYLFFITSKKSPLDLLANSSPNEKIRLFREIILYSISNKYYENPTRPGRYLFDEDEIANIESSSGIINGPYVIIGSWLLDTEKNEFSATVLTNKGYTVNCLGELRLNKEGRLYLRFNWERIIHRNLNSSKQKK